MKSIITISFFVLISMISKAQTLEAYLQEAELNSPVIQAMELRHTIASEKVNEVNTLPNTTIGAGYFVSEPETRTGAQRARFSVSQMLPWFGTITARQNYAGSMADAEYTELVIAKRKLALSVAQSYYSLFGIQATQEVLDENIALLRTYEKLALTSVEVGKASAVDVLKLQIRQNELQQKKQVLEQRYMAEQAVFNNLLNRDERIFVEVVDDMQVPAEDVLFNKEDLSLNPELLKYDQLFESVVQSEVLNQKENAPSFGVGLDYIPVTERPDMVFSDNGKDILMPMVTLSIPIFNNKFKSVSKQNELKQKEIEFQKEERLNILENAYAKAVSQRNEARISFETQAQNLKQAKDAEEILIKNYETGTINFNDVLDIQELQLKFQTNQIQSVQLYYMQSAFINYLINK